MSCYFLTCQIQILLHFPYDKLGTKEKKLPTWKPIKDCIGQPIKALSSLFPLVHTSHRLDNINDNETYCKRGYFRAVKFLRTYPTKAYSRNQKFVQIINNSLCSYMISIFTHTIFSRIHGTPQNMRKNMYCAKMSTFTVLHRSQPLSLK